MTDHDRGAYTPQTDAPLAFDARQPRGGGGGGGSPTTLIVSGIVLVLLIVAVVVFYRGGVRGTNEAPQPVGVPVGELKSAAPPEAQPPAAEPPMAVYDSGQPASGETAFAPTPEQPLPRPAARPAVNIQADDLEAAGPPPPRPAPAAAPPRPLPAPVAAQPKPAAPVAVQPKPAVTPAPAAGGPAVVQIGAFSSEALANKGWSDIASAFPGDMSGKGRRVESVESNGATLYRGQVTGFASREAAAAFCAKLKAAGKNCIVK